MKRILGGCLVAMMLGAAALAWRPQAAPLILVLLVIPAIVMLQAILLGATRLLLGSSLPETDKTPSAEPPADWETAYEGAAHVRVWLGRAVGWGAALYGAWWGKPYFLALGVAVVGLFWLLDRLAMAPSAADSPREPSGRNPDAE